MLRNCAGVRLSKLPCFFFLSHTGSLLNHTHMKISPPPPQCIQSCWDTLRRHWQISYRYLHACNTTCYGGLQSCCAFQLYRTPLFAGLTGCAYSDWCETSISRFPIFDIDYNGFGRFPQSWSFISMEQITTKRGSLSCSLGSASSQAHDPRMQHSRLLWIYQSGSQLISRIRAMSIGQQCCVGCTSVTGLMYNTAYSAEILA